MVARRRRRKKGKSYFTSVTEEAIIKYNNSSDPKERTELYIEHIQPAFSQLVDKIELGDVSKEMEVKYLSTHNDYSENREKDEFWSSLWYEIESWDTGSMKSNELRVLNAVKDLMDASDKIEIFNKKAIYLYIREATGLNTKQVVNNLNKIRLKYRTFRFKWNQGDI